MPFKKFVFYFKTESPIVLVLWIVLIIATVFFVVGGILTTCQQPQELDLILTEELAKQNEIARVIETQNETSIFKGLGKIRAITNDSPSKILIVSPVFPYKTTDSSFIEELKKKQTVLRGLVVDYFKAFSFEDITKKGEETIKAELIKGFNEKLVLAKVEELLFEDFLFIP